MIKPIDNVTAISFMSLFPEMRDEWAWDKVVSWVAKGGGIPLLNLGVFEGGQLVGLFPIETHAERLMIHACFLPEYRGQFAVDAAKEAFTWLSKNTNQRVVKAYIEPEHVKNYAKRCGMIEKNGLFEVMI